MLWDKKGLLLAALFAVGLLAVACGPLAARTVEKTVYVGPSLADCEDAAPKQCLLVREDVDQEWVQHSDQIDGFDYEAGFQYELRVAEEQAGRSADGSSDPQWTLVEVIDRSRAVEGTIWVLSKYVDSAGEPAEALEGSTATIRFLHGDLSGNASCNSFFGSYELGPEWLNITPGGMTEMYCSPEELMNQEREFLTLLTRADIYLLEENQLRILDEDWKLLLTFGPMQNTPLVGTPWQLTGYDDGAGGFVSVLAGTTITAGFSEDGQLAGSAGCNSYSGSYEINGAELSLGSISNTEMACVGPAGIMEQEVAFLSVLRLATSHQLEGRSLVLFNEQGYALLTFGLVEEPSVGLGQGLMNMEFQSEWTQSGSAPLVDGEYREPAATGSATETVIRLTEHAATGTVSGQAVTVVILATDPGGSGTFYDLAAVAERDGQPAHVASTFLGDRVQIQSFAIVGDEILVEMLRQGDNDPMCCPSEHVVLTYALEGEELVLMSGK